PYRRFVRTQTSLVLAAVHHPDIVLAVYEDIVGRSPGAFHVCPAGDLFVRIGDVIDAGITGLGLCHANQGRGRKYYHRKSDRFHVPPYSSINYGAIERERTAQELLKCLAAEIRCEL